MRLKKHMDNQSPAVPWLQAIKVTKLLTIIVVIQLIVIIGLGIAFSTVFPLKEKIPIVVEFQSGGNNFVIVAKAGEDLRNNKALVSRELRYYIISRETIDRMTEETIRYPRVMAMSSSDVKKEFKDVYGNKEKALYFKEGAKRKIIINRDASLAPGIHQVDFTTIDTITGREGETRRQWVATIKYEFSDQKVLYNEQTINPLGLFITGYDLSNRIVK